MQISRDTAALLFLRFDQLTAYFFQRLLGELLISAGGKSLDKAMVAN